MPQNYTIISFDEGSPLRCIMRRLGVIETHLHETLELDMVLTGSCQVTVGTETFTAGVDDLFSVDARIPHSFSGKDCTLITVQFEQSYFERTLPEPRHPDFICNSALQGNSAAFDELRRLVARLVKNNAERRLGYELRNWSMIYQVMDVMYQNFRVEDSEARNQRAHRYAARMADISRIINENYQEDLTLSQLADRIHLSAPYLSKFFDRQFGVSFLSYLTRVRLNHAVEELQTTDNTIETVSANAGFPNSHAFVQAFKKEYGVLPSIFRRQERKKTAREPAALQVEQHDYMAGLKKYLEAPEEEKAQQAISCRASVSARKKIASLRHTWRTMIGVVSASSVLTAEVQQILRRIQREVGFRYIKFNGILSDDMHVCYQDREGKLTYSFAYVDKVFDFLLSVGLRPFVQLSFMPEALAGSRRRLFGYLVSEPQSLEKWSALVSALIAHLQERYGSEELRQWFFSVWHQPDTPFMYGFSSDESFYRFYRETYRAVKSRDEGLFFGAPSTYYLMQPGYRNWYIPFLHWCRQQGCTPDFLNFSYYDLVITESEGGQSAFGFTEAMTLGETPDGLSSFVTQVRSERHQLGADAMPLFLTEWNNTPSQQDLLNDTCFKSCYIVKGILENYDRLDSFAYWSLTDWMGEAAQPKEMFFGGLGMFTANGIPKASYYAFTLLRRLGGTLLGRGEGWFITRQDESYRIILYNYRHFSHLYAQGERFDMTFTERYTPFSPEQLLDVHLSIQDAEPGSYIVTETVISRSSGSAFDQWAAMGALELTDPEELANLAARSLPAITKYITSAPDGVLQLDAMLDMLEVRLICVTKTN